MRIILPVVFAFSLLFSSRVSSQSVQDAVVVLNANIDLATPKVTLTWGNPTASTFVLFRREKDSPDWFILLEEVGSTTNTFVDEFVNEGQTYEYGIQRQTNNNVFSAGYVMVPIEAPVVDFRGEIAVFVEAALEAPLATELERFRNDLRGDGWVVRWHSVPANATVATVKSQVVADYNDFGINSVFLFGQIPVPYSGNSDWDGHAEHQGAWPADSYYSDVNSSAWTDVAVNTNLNGTPPARPENFNIPGDGKFDQDLIPTTSELAVGRVDFSNLSLAAFGTSQLELYRRYLDKNHNWRSKQYTVDKKVLVDDNFGYFGGEAFAANGYRNGNPLVGPSNVVAGDFFNDTDDQSFLFAYGCGGGTYTSASGVGSSSQFGTDTVNAVFTQLFGSYHGDWDYSPDPFMMSALASKGGILTCSWAGRPHWFTHHLGAGETMGYSTSNTANSCDIPGYFNLFGDCGTHVALMGDPTVRAQIVAPVPTNSVTAVQFCDQVQITWAASPQAEVIGYHVYRASQLDGVYDRISTVLVTSLSFVDDSPQPGDNTYAVKAVVREVTASGIFFNTSTGILKTISVGPTAPPSFNMPATVNLNCTNTSYLLNPCGPGVQCQVTGPGITMGQLPMTISTPGTYTVSAFDPASSCTATADLTVNLNTNAPVTPTATIGAVNCVAQTVQLNGMSNPTGVTYTWTGPNNFTSNLQNTTATAGGTYTLTATLISSGCTSSTTINVPSPAAPGATATGGFINCIATSVQLQGTSPLQNVTYAWTGPNGFQSASQNPTVSVVGTYELTVSGQNGCVSTATATVTLQTNEPQASPTVAATLTCATVQTTISANPDDAGYNYLWSGPNGFQSASQNPTVTQSGTYTLVVTDPISGCSNQAVATVQQNIAAPVGTTAELGQVDCVALNVQLLGDTETTPVTYAWSGPSGFTSTQQNTVASLPGAYTLTVTSTTNGCTASSSVSVSSFALPNATATGGSLTCSVTTVQLFGSTTTPNAGIQWNGPNGFTSNELNPIVSVAGDYTLVVTSPSGCTATASAPVSQLGDFPVATPAVSNIITCLVQQATINANPAQSGYSFAWSGPSNFTSTAQNVTVSTPGLYFVQVQNLQTGCIATYSGLVEQFEPPITSIELPSVELNCNVTSIPINLEAICGTPGYTCTLNGQPVGNQVNITQPGNYVLVANHTSSGCSVSDDFDVVFNGVSPNLSIAGDLQLDCADDVTIVTANSSTPGTTFLWAGINSNPTQTLSPGSYTVTAIGENGCETDATVVVQSPPALNIEVVFILGCEGIFDPNTLVTGGVSPYDIFYSPSAPFPPNTSFQITVLDANNCPANFSSNTGPAPAPIQATATHTDETVLGQNDGTATALPTGGSGGYTYEWSNGQTTQTATNLAPGTYTCEVTDASGCVATVTVTILEGTSGTDELPGLRSLRLSPNPTGGSFELTLAFENPLSVQVALLDVAGRILSKSNTENVVEKTWQFDLSASPSGVYFCKIIAEGQVAMMKVVKM